ncbi:MAG: MG2 domain-containing protein, partial [Thermodesulfovibrionales bacterium]|nr:MG2 domain-containing protein [Thermodesulfovibrionales bacterium]
MRHILRRFTQNGFDYFKKSELPNTAEIIHQGSGQTYEIPIKFDNLMSATSDWQIPIDAKLGTYQIHLKHTQKGKEVSQSIPSTTFRVEEFKVPLMKATIKPVKTELINPSVVDLDLSVQFLSGGGAKRAPVILRTRTSPMDVYFDDYDDFEFMKGPVKVGISKRGFYDDEGNEDTSKESAINTMNLTLDEHGFIRTKIDVTQSSKKAQKISAELQFTDPNGEIQTVSRQIPLYPASIAIGVKPESWASSIDNVKVHALTLDLKGNPVPNSKVKIEAYKKTYYSHRKRLIGGFYSYEHLTEIQRISEVCSGESDNTGIFNCEFKPKLSGNLILQASTTDRDGNESVTHSELWVSGKDEQWFDVSDNDRIDLIPIKKGYEPKETARFQVRMPFREATALITVEREGILDAYVKTISGKDPIIELPIKNNYAPNVFVSALLVRGRVAGIKPTSMVDLGKPAFKLGIAEIRVGWKAHELKVQIKTDKEKYRVREQVKAKIKVTNPNGVPLNKEMTSLAVAVVDEGLLELMNNKSWDLLQSMMEQRAYQVATATAQMQIVGKRHFGMKALPQGGGGGRQITRELFDTLLYWNPHMSIDESGEAELLFSINDSVTSFRIVVIAHSGKDLFGTGFKSIKSWQDVMIFSGLPKMVREGDKYTAVFTIRNATEKALDLQINATTRDKKQGEIILPQKEIKFTEGQSLTVDWDVTIPKDIDQQEWKLEVKTKDGILLDNIKAIQKVNTLYPVKTFYKEIIPVDKPISLFVERPTNAITGTTSLQTRLHHTITTSLDDVKSMMQNYPYTCLEQKISKAIVLNEKTIWQSIINELPSYIDERGLLKFFPTSSTGNDALTSYLLSITHEAGINLPESIITRLQEGLLSFITGKIQGHSSLQTADLNIRKLSAIEALSRYDKVEALYITPLKIDVSILPTSTLIDWINILKRVRDIPDRDKKYKEAINHLSSRIVLHGTTVGLKTENTDTLWWLMVSRDLIINKIVLLYLEDPQLRNLVPRLVNGTITRQIKGTWDTTTANAWGYLAINKFIKAYESNHIAGKTTLSLDGVGHVFSWTEEGIKGQEPKNIELKLTKQKVNLKAQHTGTGMPWLTVKVVSAIITKEPVYKGYKIKKTYQPIEQKETGFFSVGDKIKVKIEMSASSDMTWVALKDPIPTGAVIISKGISDDRHNSSKSIVPT